MSAMLTYSCVMVLALALALQQVDARTYYSATNITVPGVPGAWLRGYVTLADNWRSGQAPTAVGVEMSQAFVNSQEKLPLIRMQIPGNFTLRSYSTWIDMPRPDAQPFRRFFFGYEGNGHPPAPMYATPHWDLHFVFDNATVWAPFNDPALAGPCEGFSPAAFSALFQPIPTQCFPRTHSQVGNWVFGHGSHLIPLGAPEFNPPRTFNQTLIYGAFGGQLRFMEPMASIAYVNSTAVKKVAQWFRTLAPGFFATARYIPQKYGYFWTPRGTARVQYEQFSKSRACVYSERAGYSNWLPPSVVTPGTMCTAPTPATWNRSTAG